MIRPNPVYERYMGIGGDNACIENILNISGIQETNSSPFIVLFGSFRIARDDYGIFCGDDNGSGGIGLADHQVDQKYTKTYNRDMTRGRELTVYLIDDNDFDFNHELTIDEFAAENNGNYFVVVTSLH